MFLHYINIISRHLIRNKWLSFLKLLSLTLGLCAFIIVMVINHSERTWNHHWEDAENIYILKSEFGTQSTENFLEVLQSNKFQTESITGVVGRVARPNNLEKPPIHPGRQYPLGITDSSFFDVFKLGVVAGDISDFTNTPDAIIITQELSENLFGQDSAIDKVISIPTNETSLEENSDFNLPNRLFKVVAVIENPSPRSTPIHHAYIKKINIAKRDSPNNYLDTRIFVKLNRNVSQDLYQQHLDDMFDAHYKAVHPNSNTWSEKELLKHKLKLLLITDIHLDKDLSPGKSTTLWILYLIAAAVLLVSLVNYINIVISSQLQRQKEIAIYRLAGASYGSLFSLFLVEAFIFLISSFAITLAITQPVLPWLFELLAIQSDFGIEQFGQLWVYLASLLIFVSILLALFPLLSIKNTMPARILSANQYTERSDSRFLRYTFLCFQFFAAGCFCIAAGIMSLQIHHSLNRDLGYSYKNVHQFHFQGFVSVDQKTVLIQELKKNPITLGVSRMAAGISSNNLLTQVSKADLPREKAVDFNLIYVADFDFFDTYSIDIIAGKLPKDLIRLDYTTPGEAVVCQHSLNALGFSDAESAVNQDINLYFSDGEAPLRTRIAAVSSQISSGGLLATPMNCIFWNAMTPEAGIPFAIRYKEGNLEETRKLIRETAIKIVGTEPIDWSLKDEIEGSIKQEKLINQFLYAFLVIILVICLLGIYGVSSLDAQKRKKEIALRKLHGANRWDIIQLLSKRFLAFILIAHAAAMPVGLYFMSDWLKEFPNQINLYAWGFALTMMSVVVVFALTSAISTLHTFRIVSARPADTLKTE